MVKQFRIYVTDYFRRKIIIDEKLIGSGIEVILLQELDEKKLFPKMSNADAIIVDKTKLTEYSFSHLSNCKIIVRLGVGFDNVDLKSAGEHGIRVCNVPDFCTFEVAEHAMAMLIDLCRNMSVYREAVLSGNVESWNPLIAEDTKRIHGKTLGIIGLGRIGSEVAKRAKAFGMDVLFFDPYVGAEYGKTLGARKVSSLKELAAASDAVSFHTPLNEETRHMGNKDFFGMLKRGAIVINTSRGGIINTDDLFTAMKDGIVSKAGLDVLETEPIDYSKPLFKAWLGGGELRHRLMITPHAAFFSEESTEEIKVKIIENIKRVFSGKEPINCVNKAFLQAKKVDSG